LKEIAGTRSDFICRLVGEGPDLERLKQLAGSLGFPEGMIRFEGLVEGDVLADLVRKSDFSVLSSNYETFGTVVIESLACGVPVVATNVGVVPTVINKSNGVVVAPGDPNALYLAINYLMDHCREYDKKEVRDSVYGKFSLDSVASEVMGIYQQIIKKHV
jgi:glycosyltransferase involved in cell wall biosynthesis